MGVHTSLRSALYKDAYIAESYNKDYYAKQIASNYLPVLEYEYIRTENGEGRAVDQSSAFTPEVEQELTDILLAFLLAECAEMYKQTRITQKNLKYSKKKKNNNWL
jgi:hypothetical protein